MNQPSETQRRVKVRMPIKVMILTARVLVKAVSTDLCKQVDKVSIRLDMPCCVAPVILLASCVKVCDYVRPN